MKNFNKCNRLKKGSTGHHIQSGNPENFQNLDCPETGRFPSRTPEQNFFFRNLFKRFTFLKIRSFNSDPANLGVRSCQVLSGHETHMPSLGEPYLGPFVTVLVSMTTPSFANIFAVNYVLWSTQLLNDHLWEKLEIIF